MNHPRLSESLPMSITSDFLLSAVPAPTVPPTDPATWETPSVLWFGLANFALCAAFLVFSLSTLVSHLRQRQHGADHNRALLGDPPDDIADLDAPSPP
jgi:hypothetical protein